MVIHLDHFGFYWITHYYQSCVHWNRGLFLILWNNLIHADSTESQSHKVRTSTVGSWEPAFVKPRAEATFFFEQVEKKTGCFKNDSGISNNCMILQPVWVVWFLRILGGGWRLAFGPCACWRRGASTGLHWIWQTCGGFIPQWSPSCRCPFDALVGQSGEGFHRSIWWRQIA